METNGSYAQLLQKWKRNARYPYFRSLRSMLKCKSAKQNVKIPGHFQTQTHRVSLVRNLSVAAGGITFWRPVGICERPPDRQTENMSGPARPAAGPGSGRAGRPPLLPGALPGSGAKSIPFTGH